MSPSRSHSRAFAGTGQNEAEAPEAPTLAALYRRHAEDVATWARRLGGPSLDAEDVVHEVFLVVQRRLPEWRGDAKITTWLYEITFRVVHDRRKRWRRPGWWPRRADAPGGDDEAQLPADQPDALDLLERREASATLYRLLDGIGEKYRTVLVLFELEGKSGEEIAALTGASLPNVWIRLHRGRQRLMQRFLAWEAKGRPCR
jgi:RNA polymerase sigma-70 factor (ECF subfamily)